LLISKIPETLLKNENGIQMFVVINENWKDEKSDARNLIE